MTRNALGRVEQLTLRQVDALVNGPLKIAVPELPGTALTDESIAAAVPGLKPFLDARQKVLEYHRELRSWAQRRASESREVIDQDVARAEDKKRALLAEAASRIKALGVSLSGETLPALRETFRVDVLQAVENTKREEALLGREGADPLPGQVLIPGSGATDIVDAARRIRELLDQGEAADVEQKRLRDRFEAVDPVDIDQEYLGWMREVYPGGRVPIPGSDARPSLGPEVLHTLRRAGIDIGEKPE